MHGETCRLLCGTPARVSARLQCWAARGSEHHGLPTMKLLAPPPPPLALSRAPRSSLPANQGAAIGLDRGTSRLRDVSSDGDPSRAAVRELGLRPCEIDLGRLADMPATRGGSGARGQGGAARNAMEGVCLVMGATCMAEI